MSETSSCAQSSNGAAGFTKHERLFLALAAGGIVFALVMAVLLLRLQRLDELPPGIASDEGSNGMDALRVLQGEHAVFYPEKGGGRETLGFYLIALSILFLGRTPLAIHLPSALASSGTILVVFWLGRLFFGRDENGRATPWRGLLVGGAGAGLLAVSIGQTVIGRTAYRGNFLPVFLCLCLALLWWGWPRTVQKWGASRGSLVAHCIGGRVCRTAALHLYPGAFRPLSVPPLRFEFLTALFRCCQAN